MTDRIKNRESLARTKARVHALQIAEAGYQAVDPSDAIMRKVFVHDGVLEVAGLTFPLTGRRIFLVGVGKCAIHGGLALEKILGSSLTSGILYDIARPERIPSTELEILIGTHPLPSTINATTSAKLLEFLTGRSAEDLVIFLISGGGSALLALPPEPLTVESEVTLMSTLIERAVSIQEVNLVRKHLSRARGGALAVACYPAEVLSLIISDVPGDALGTVASGPTIRDASTVADAKAVLDTSHGVLPHSALIETPKDSKYFERVHNIPLLSSHDALVRMSAEAHTLGYAVQIVDAQFTGEAATNGRAVAELLHQSAPQTALLYAGESTVSLGAGSPAVLKAGGRSQELALAALPHLAPDELVLAFATDGHDNTAHAGAISDALTQEHARQKDESAITHAETHHSYAFFATTGDALITGETGANVADLIIALKG